MADRAMRSRPAPGTCTSLRRFAAAAIASVNVSVTSTSKRRDVALVDGNQLAGLAEPRAHGLDERRRKGSDECHGEHDGSPVRCAERIA
jgi:hypothetical protein